MNNKKIIIAICLTLAIILIVTSGTFAYWTWRTSASQNTVVDFSVVGDEENIRANIDGGAITVNKLAPTNSCYSDNAFVKEIKISYLNNVNTTARIRANLKISGYTASNSIPNSSNLEYLKWSITKTRNLCTNDGSTNYVAGGNFSGLNGNPALLTANQTNKVSMYTIEEVVPANVSTLTNLNTYYLHVWIDNSYDHVNIGNNNNDPLQNFSINLEWSGTIEQLG